METASLLLLIIVSSILSVLLILLIVISIKIIKIISVIKTSVDKAEELITSAEEAANLIKKSAGPIAIGKFIVNIADAVTKRKNK